MQLKAEIRQNQLCSASDVLEEEGFPQVAKDRLEEECPVVHWLKVTALGSTPYVEMKGQLYTLKEEN